MKVRELIEHLLTLDQELPVCINDGGYWKEVYDPPFQTETWFGKNVDIVGISSD
jgi:hypothetical protein